MAGCELDADLLDGHAATHRNDLYGNLSIFTNRSFSCGITLRAMNKKILMIAPAIRPAIIPANVPANIQIKKNVTEISIKISCFRIRLRLNFKSKNKIAQAAIKPVINITASYWFANKICFAFSMPDSSPSA